VRGLKRYRPSPAMIVALIALIAATTGGAIAANGLVTSAGVKNNSLTGKDIKNKSIGRVDLSKAALRGRGPAGPPGPPGAAGPAGPSAGFHFDSGAADLPGSTSPQTVATLALPPGNYALFAKVLAVNGPVDLSTFSCTLSLGVNVIDTGFPLTLGVDDRDYFPLSGRGTLAAAGAATVACSGAAGSVFRDRHIEAIQVGSLP
jgi:hypothetical protein